MIYFKRYIKFRKESKFILLCNCSNITNFEIPLKYWKLLNKLKSGYAPDKTLGMENEKQIILDLKNLNMLSDTFDSNEGFEDPGWLSLDYTETELFKSNQKSTTQKP